MNTIANYFKSVRNEMKHVVWPSRKATINHTISVILISVAVAIFLFEFDNLFTAILNLFIK